MRLICEAVAGCVFVWMGGQCIGREREGGVGNAGRDLTCSIKAASSGSTKWLASAWASASCAVSLTLYFGPL